MYEMFINVKLELLINNMTAHNQKNRICDVSSSSDENPLFVKKTS
jgi:hypothetical protein